jgi:RNA polymerase sigma-70 factor (ECF subfamily)
MATVVPDNVSLERELEAQETLKLIYASLAKLPQNARQAFILNRAKGMTYPVIAKQMGVSVSSVEKYILVSLKHLRRVVEISEQ